MRQSNLDKLIDRAKDKADGTYSMNGIAYRVKNRNLTHYVDYNRVFAMFGVFSTCIGEFQYPCEAKKALKQLKD